MMRKNFTYFKIFIFLVLVWFVAGCISVSRKSRDEIMRGSSASGLPIMIANIFYYAGLAPSSHNTQPWKVKVISDSEFILQADHSRWLSKVDPQKRELILSLGAFWENFNIAAKASGLEAETEILAKSCEDVDILKIKLSRYPNSEVINLSLMQKRATNRRPYLKKELSASDLEKIKNAFSGNLYYFSRSSKEGEWIASGLAAAIKEQAFDDEKQYELSEWLRFSARLADKREDGLSAEALGLSGKERFFWYSFMKPKNALLASFRNKTVERAKLQVDNCAGFVVITSKDASVESLLNAGRDLQRLELLCTELKVWFHPMSQLIEGSPWNNDIGKAIAVSDPIQFVVRLGYVKGSAAQSIRRPLKEFLVY